MPNDYDRVSQVLYPFSGLTKIDPSILKNAADRGTRVHELCDSLMSNFGIFEMEPDLSGYIESFKKYFNDKNFIDKPPRFYCDEHKITGECDALYKTEDGLVLVDLKTPVRESKTWRLQGSAYSYLAKKAGYSVSRIEFVRLCKKGKEPEIFIYEENFPKFLQYLQVYRECFKNQNEIDVNHLI